MYALLLFMFVFFFIVTATTDIYTYLHTLSLHDALPIYPMDKALFTPSRLSLGRHARRSLESVEDDRALALRRLHHALREPCDRRLGDADDRKSTRLNSSH